MTDKSLAVIIPVFNGQEFITRCLQSMIEQEELTEIIIVDDGSTDNSIDIINAFANKDTRIQVLQHKDNTNLGRSATRNLGIKSASSRWITFCDIDDYFLADRFKPFATTNFDAIDGTHEPVQADYKNATLSSSTQEVTAVSKNFDQPRGLQDFLISHREERISIISLIIKKSKIEDIGYFDENLKAGEDTDLIWRLTGISSLRYFDVGAPRVIRGVHNQNTYQNREEVHQSRKAFYKKWMTEMEQYNLSAAAKNRITESHQYYNGSNLSILKSKLGRLWGDGG